MRVPENPWIRSQSHRYYHLILVNSNYPLSRWTSTHVQSKLFAWKEEAGGGEPGTPHLRTLPFVRGRLTSEKDSCRRWSTKGPSVRASIQHGPACHLSLTCSQSPRCEGKEGIRGEHGPPQGEQQSKPQGRHWLASRELASLGPASCPLCPKDAQHGWQLSRHTRSPSGGSCPDALQINSVSSARPPNCSGAPQGAGSRCFLSDGFPS